MKSRSSMTTPHTTRRRQHGFTIVELLIVIVVIAILAAISIVAYTGIQDRARTSALKAEMSQLQRRIQVEALQNSDEAVSIKAPIAYITQIGSGPLAEPIINGHEVTLYTVFDTNNNQTASWSTISDLQPRTSSQKFEIRTSGSGNSTVNASYTTSTQNDLSIGRSGIRNTTGRHVGWHTASADLVEAGFNNSSSSGNRNIAAHDGWNFEELRIVNLSSARGVAALVFPEYHDEATRRAVLKWLDSEYSIDYYNE